MAHRTKDYFSYNRYILKCAGLWAPENCSYTSKILYRLYAIFVFLFVNLYFTSTEFVSLFDTYKRPYDLIKNVNFALTHAMGAVKCVFWFYQGDKLKQLINTLEDPDLTYEEVNGFSPDEIFSKYKRKGKIYTVSFFLLAHLTLSSSYVPPIVSAVTFDSNKNETFVPKLPYFSWVPFDYNTPSRFLFVLAYQAGPMFSYAYSIVGMDTLFMNIMNFIVAHLCLVQGAFLTTRVRCLKKVRGDGLAPDGLNNSKDLSKKMIKDMKKIIEHLQTIFK